MADRLKCSLCVLICCVNYVVCLDAPEDVKVSYLEPFGLYVEWKEVKYNFRDPISGYKVKLWPVREETTRNYKLLNGEQYPGLEKNDFAKEPFNTDPSTKDVREITVKNPSTSARILGVIPDRLYEIRVMAFKGDEIGPMSELRRVKLINNDKFVLLAQRTVGSCVASIVTNIVDTNEPPFVYNSIL